ncbi:MAG: hypothetical protein ACTSRK_18615 [Promethearchaeota archaeon]
MHNQSEIITQHGSVNPPDPRNINAMLKSYQQRIISQISRTQQLLRNQLTIIFLQGLTIAIFLIPFLFIERDARTMGAGVIILFGFNYNVFFQYSRKKPLIHEAHSYLKTLQGTKNTDNGNENPLFVQTISQYLEKLYQILFYDGKSNRLLPQFLTNPETEDYSEIEQKLMRSLNKDVILNMILGGCYVIAAVAAMVLMPERILDPYTQISFLALALFFALMIMVCISLRNHLTSWMKGFVELRSWTISIEGITSNQNTNENTVGTPISGEHLPKSSLTTVYCSYCGEGDQIPNKYCQNCGKMINL